METKPTLLVVVALALLDTSDRVLMQRRPETRAHGGLWEFPGGKVEPGEGPAAALVREISEELSVTIRAADMVPLMFAANPEGEGARPLVLLLYTCRCWEGTPVPEPGSELQWLNAEALVALPMPPLDVPLAAALQRHLKNLH
ncbi:(deoxy)nucleoside triphosphate pyrophosphohydrolase [Novosphingobium sp.]|uniref:(deoxy)nucleoside triphosphate pyrophosphohydrolase n=1 Tax=Novosphingobium sp. TaxID=1874826 RepID=UPI001E13A1C7|nr:(deoxy)nucleoside triphosphate pyrophosphohydrolase [Novosphingobium sp.]MBX9662687.1 (deoxy)nucleoside triphosphate pyrophosphohydrolase [Novosphingobium sp.]